MPDVRITRPIPGTDFRPGDIMFADDEGTVLLMRELTDRDIEAIRLNLPRVAIFSPSASWLALYSHSSAPAPSGLQVVR